MTTFSEVIKSLKIKSFLSVNRKELASMVEDYEERAAIMEYDGGLSRHKAEQEAAKIVATSCKKRKG